MLHKEVEKCYDLRTKKSVLVLFSFDIDGMLLSFYQLHKPAAAKLGNVSATLNIYS